MSVCKGLAATVLAAAIVAPAVVMAQTSPTKPASLDLTLKPHLQAGEVDYIDVRMTLGHPDAAKDAVLVHMPLVVASIPTARYDGDALQASDAQGPLTLTPSDLPPTSFLSYREWKAGRATSGDVTLSFHAPPRVVSASTRNGPLFDLRAEAGGVDGAGYVFLPLPTDDRARDIHIHWDLSGLPAGARGVSSFGEGDVQTIKPADSLAQTYFYAGPVKSYPAAGSDAFAMYWLSEPPFDAAQAATMIKGLYDYTSRFFHDAGGSYRVFIRKQPYKGGGGTALYRSFMFGYGAGKAPTSDDLEGLIAHEMVHNWPALDGDHADVSWYAEGTAEYYSVLLSLRAGLSTPDEFLKRVNERAAGYYTNPLQTLSNRQADEIYWKDTRAGHVPYGRGFMYFAKVDAQIRARSHGRRSLDDLVLNIVDRRRKGEKVGPDGWKALITRELGAEGRRGYEDMAAGKPIVPPANAFAPCFHPAQTIEHPTDPGFDMNSLIGAKKVIKSLSPDSAAAKAGLREGDEVVQSPDVGDPGLDLKKPMTLVVRRDGKDTPITFTPSGKPVTGYRWIRNAKVSDHACKA